MRIFGYSLERNYDKHGECLKCPFCSKDNLTTVVKDTIESTVCEYETHCQDCSKVVGYWAYGGNDPCFKFYDRSLPALKDRIMCKLRRISTP